MVTSALLAKVGGEDVIGDRLHALHVHLGQSSGKQVLFVPSIWLEGTNLAGFKLLKEGVSVEVKVENKILRCLLAEGLQTSTVPVACRARLQNRARCH